MIISEIYQKNPFDIIAMTPRGTLGLCCVHITQLMNQPAIYTLPFTLQLCYKPLGILQRVNKSQKVHTSSHDKLQKLHNINFPGNGFPRFYPRGFRETGISSFPRYLFKKQWKTLSLEFESQYTILNEEQEESLAAHIGTHCGHSCCNKNFQILLTSDLHQLADDAYENHIYIEYLFIL